MASSSGPSNSGVSAGGNKNDDHHLQTTSAAFSPAHSVSSPSGQQRSAILVHQKSPLLVATPPAVTRALAFSHPFLLPLNKLAGLLTWSSGDPWESFLVVAAFWAITLYGDFAVRYTGPLIVVAGLILLMYSRRYSPLSSTGWSGEKLQSPEPGMKHQKSLDEIVDTLNEFTSRCDMLLEPFLQLTEFLSTQRTATSATTRPALTSLFIRILMVSPLWIGLTFPPFYVMTTKRVVLAAGTMVLSWQSRPARVSRALLWRSRLIRRALALLTGLEVGSPEHLQEETSSKAPPLPARTRTQKHQSDFASSLARRGVVPAAGVRFTFGVYENQRRWLGLGWTSSLLAYERAAWTDENLNPADSKENFHLPEVENGTARWRWVKGSEWQVDTGGKSRTKGQNNGWIYYDNKWQDGRRGQDGWGRYTRRRKWYRDAELVEADGEDDLGESTATLKASPDQGKTVDTPTKPAVGKEGEDGSTKRRGFFKRRNSGRSSRSAQSSGDFSVTTTLRNDDDDSMTPGQQERQSEWSMSDDMKMGMS